MLIRVLAYMDFIGMQISYAAAAAALRPHCTALYITCSYPP